MAKSAAKKASNIFVWIILGLLMIALAGFGIGSFGGTVRVVAQVGDQEVDVQEYARALQQDQQRLSRQTGQALTLQQMQTFGLDQIVLQRLVATAALNNEAARLGLSVGDAEIARQIRATPAFQGISGQFDREGYAFALRNADLSEGEYEASVRQDTARGLLQGAVIGGIAPSDLYAETLVKWQYETRDITLARIVTADLPAGMLAPSDADLQAFYEANELLFTRPEARDITVAWISPDDLVDEVEVPMERLRELYAERADEFSQPERVLAERLGFADEAAATAALSAIADGDTTFDDLVAERGLTLEDIDQGELAAADLPDTVAQALFALEQPGLVGPLETALGPAIYRVNAILSATEVPFDIVVPDLNAEVAADLARRRISGAMGDIDDLLAAGATLEELGTDTDMVLETLTFSPASVDGIAGYAAFRAAAQLVQEGDFPELLELSDGGIFALRLEAIIPPTLPPLEDIREDVAARWQTDSNIAQLEVEAARLAATLDAETDMNAAGLRAESIAALRRDGFVDGLPPALLERAFAAEPGTVISGAGQGEAAFVLRVDAVTAADLAADDVAAALTQARGAVAQGMAQDIFEGYGQAVQNAAGLSVNQAAINAVHASFGQGGGY